MQGLLRLIPRYQKDLAHRFMPKSRIFECSEGAASNGFMPLCSPSARICCEDWAAFNHFNATPQFWLDGSRTNHPSDASMRRAPGISNGFVLRIII